MGHKVCLSDEMCSQYSMAVPEFRHQLNESLQLARRIYKSEGVKEKCSCEITLIVRVFILGTKHGSRLLPQIPVDVTHSGSSVDLVPAAEDEAGLGIVHPDD